jgi:hypothetical protein
MAAATLVLVVALGATPALGREVGGVDVPETVTEGGRTLRLNGAGVRTRAMMFRVYAIGLYTPQPAHSADAVLHGEGVRRVDLHLLRDLSGDEIGAAIREGVERNAGERLPELRERLDRLVALFPAVREGDVVVLTFVPGTGTRIRAGGRDLGTIEGEDFNRALLSVWLGQRPVDEALKRRLLGGDEGPRRG